jgi:hypothetical protein
MFLVLTCCLQQVLPVLRSGPEKVAVKDQIARYSLNLSKIGGEEAMRDYEMQRQLIQDGARSTTPGVATDGLGQLRIADTRMDQETLIMEIVMDPGFQFYVKVSKSL